MKRLLSFTIISLSFLAFTQAQTKNYGALKITEEKGIETLIANKKASAQGYRVQVFTGNATERTKAQSIASSIENTYKLKTYVKYEQPQFKVRVGNFIDKLEAVKLKHKLAKTYPNTYIVKVENLNL